MTRVSDLDDTAGTVLQPPTRVHRFVVDGPDGAELHLLDLGAGVDRVRLPDARGVVDDMTLTLDSVFDREDRDRNPYLGVTVGRYANRLAGASVTIDGVEHRLEPNEGPNQLHGGPVGFDRVVWEHDLLPDGVRFSRVSADGEMGFPGRLDVSVTYRLTPGVVSIVHEATTDRPTVVSLTNHTYWNLGGRSEPDVTDHTVEVAATTVLPVDGASLPSGPPEPVEDGPFDLRAPVRLGDRIGFALPAGYDHCFVPDGHGFRRHARVTHPPSGRRLEVWSDMPGVQLYTAGFLADGPGGGGRRHGPFAALCLEPQHLPDAPNQPWAPSPVLRPGHRYVHRLELRYGADAGEGS